MGAYSTADAYSTESQCHIKTRSQRARKDSMDAFATESGGQESSIWRAACSDSATSPLLSLHLLSTLCIAPPFLQALMKAAQLRSPRFS